MISIMRCRGLGPPHMRWGVLEVMYRDNDCGHLLEQWVEIPLDELVRTAHKKEQQILDMVAKKFAGLQIQHSVYRVYMTLSLMATHLVFGILVPS